MATHFNVQSLRPDIASILNHSDRSSVSAKAVRKALQAKYPTLDVKAHKAEIDAVTTELFTAGGDGDEEQVQEHEPEETKPPLPSFTKLKRERSPSSNGLHDLPASSPAFALASTSRKSKAEEDDEAMARRLQAEFLSENRGRTTRNGTTAASTKKRTAGGKRKSKARVSDGESDGDRAPKKKKRKSPANSGFNKLHLLSPELAAVCGQEVASRPRVTKLIWRYIKAHDLQDLKKKTDVLPDQTLHRVLPFSRINSFTMAKHISPHLYEYDPAQHAHLLPPPSDDEDVAAADGSESDQKPKKPRAAITDKAGVRGSGKGLSKEEIDTEDEESD